jgi:hypothetical protein
MKKPMFILLWMAGAFIVGSLVFFGFIAIMALSISRPTEAASWTEHRALAVSIVEWLAVIGLPILALILGARGVLPGTHGNKQTTLATVQ